MRMHVLSAVLVGLVGSGVKLGLSEKVTLLFCVLLVIFAEMINSALEQLVDLAVQHFDERARLTKDIAAAAVLVLAVGTVVIFAAILVHDADAIFASPEAIERQVLLGAPLTFCAGALMHEQPRPGWVNAVLAVLALGFWAATLPASESSVFSAMTLGFLVICLGAGLKRASTR
jgi:diacylglycerol kinase (ATP)